MLSRFEIELYLFTGEEECNNNMKTFIDCIDAVKGRNDDDDDDDDDDAVKGEGIMLCSPLIS